MGKISFLKKVTFILLACLFFTKLVVNGQHNTTDSLKNVLLRTDNQEEKLSITLQLAEQNVNSNPQLAFQYGQESLRLAKKIKSDSLEHRANFYLATAYMQLGNYPSALQLFQNLIKYAQKSFNTTMLSAIYGNIGSIYYLQQLDKNALQYYSKALELLNDPKLETDEKTILLRATLLNNIGNIHAAAKEYDKAASFYRESLKLDRKINHDVHTAQILNDIGKLFRIQGKNDSALKYYQEALVLRKKINNQAGLVRSYISIGELYLNQLKDYSTSEKYLNEAVTLGKNIGAWQNVNIASSNLYQLYKQQGKYKDALNALELNKQVKDSLFNEERTRKIAELEMQFEFDRKQTELKAEQREKELYYWIGGIGLLLSLIIVSLLFMLQRNKARNSRLEQVHLQLEKVNLENDLAIKDKELATNIMHLLNKNELINDISEKLLEIKKNVGAESQPAVQKVVLDLQSNLQPDLLQEFEFRFQQVHEEFYKALNERYPNLSPNDRRLCVFLKLNMTTKEISAITHQNAKSIDVARSRLRKKLNLTGTDQNLSIFLAQLGS